MNALPDSLDRHSTPARTLGSANALGPICEINEECLHLLVDMAHYAGLHTEAFLSDLLSMVSSLDPPSLACALRFPFLLVDFGLRDLHGWQHVIAFPNRPWKESGWLTLLPRATAIKLSRETLALIWRTARTDLQPHSFSWASRWRWPMPSQQASPTIFTICDRSISAPTFSTRIRKAPV